MDGWTDRGLGALIGLGTASIVAAGRHLFRQAVLNENFERRIVALEKGLDQMPDRVTARVVEALRAEGR